MGVDMDYALEVRLADGCWHEERFPLSYMGRDYGAWNALFGFYASREEVDHPLFPDEGLPDDVSESVREDATIEGQHSHRYPCWAQIAAADWDAPLSDTPAHHHVGEWRPGDDGELVLQDFVWVPEELRNTADDLFGGDAWAGPHEWPPGAEVHLNGAVYRPVFLTARMLAPPDKDPWATLWATMRDLAARHGDSNVRLLVWFSG